MVALAAAQTKALRIKLVYCRTMNDRPADEVSIASSRFGLLQDRVGEQKYTHLPTIARLTGLNNDLSKQRRVTDKVSSLNPTEKVIGAQSRLLLRTARLTLE